MYTGGGRLSVDGDAEAAGEPVAVNGGCETVELESECDVEDDEVLGSGS